jgi:hypothetical protein
LFSQRNQTQDQQGKQSDILASTANDLCVPEPERESDLVHLIEIPPENHILLPKEFDEATHLRSVEDLFLKQSIQRQAAYCVPDVNSSNQSPNEKLARSLSLIKVLKGDFNALLTQFELVASKDRVKSKLVAQLRKELQADVDRAKQIRVAENADMEEVHSNLQAIQQAVLQLTNAKITMEHELIRQEFETEENMARLKTWMEDDLILL